MLAWRLVLAGPRPPGPDAPPGAERGEEFGKTSPIALVVILLLGLVTVLLIRSMAKRLRNVPASFDDPPGEPTAAPDVPPGPGADGGRDEPGERPRAGPTRSP